MDQQNDEVVIDLREIFGILKKGISKVLIVTALFVVVAGAYAFLWPKTYESVALIRTDQSNQSYFTARSVVEPVIVKYGVRDDKGALPRYDSFIKNIKLTQARQSKFLTVAVQAKDPQLAQDMNKMLVEGAIQRLFDVVYRSIDLRIDFAKKELSKAEEELLLAQNDLRKSRSRVDGMEYDVLFSKVNVANSRVIGVNNKLLDLQLQRENLKNSIDVLDAPSFDEKPVSPKKARTLAIALVLGLICGSMYTVLKEKL